jgi:hypothetical protein
MKKIALIIVVLSFCSSTFAQFPPPVDPSVNPFLPPPVVPGYQACQAILYANINAIGNPYVTSEESREYYEILNCPAVYRYQAQVNANAIAGNPPPADLTKLWQSQLKIFYKDRFPYRQ